MYVKGAERRWSDVQGTRCTDVPLGLLCPSGRGAGSRHKKDTGPLWHSEKSELTRPFSWGLGSREPGGRAAGTQLSAAGTWLDLNFFLCFVTADSAVLAGHCGETWV